jgi:hypothetical protein
MARCTRNRALYALPENGEEKPGRNRKYGDTARKPHEWLTEESGWRRTDFQNGTSATVISRLLSEKLLTG